MAKIKLKDQLGRVIRIPVEAKATTPAKPVTPTEVTTPTPGASPTVWKLIREIPKNITALAGLSGTGFPIRHADGSWGQDGTTSDLPEGTNLYFPEAPEDGLQYARQDGAWTLVAGASNSIQRLADADMSGHRIVRATGADTCGYASVADAAHADDVLGLTIGAALTGQMATIIDGTSITELSWAWTPLEPLFLGFDGLLTQTPPTAYDSAAQFVLPVGFAQSPTTIMVRIGTAIYY